MNFKKNFKRFFTLSRSAEGFTLVELIVVIAILGILVGVGMPAYSGYIDKANEGVDEHNLAMMNNALVVACVYVGVEPADAGLSTNDMVWKGNTFMGLGTGIATASEGETATTTKDDVVKLFNTNLGQPIVFKKYTSSDIKLENGVFVGPNGTGGNGGSGTAKVPEIFKDAASKVDTADKEAFNNSAFGTIGADKVMDQVGTVTDLAAGLFETGNSASLQMMLGAGLGNLSSFLSEEELNKYPGETTEEKIAAYTDTLIKQKFEQMYPGVDYASAKDPENENYSKYTGVTGQVAANAAVLNAAKHTGEASYSNMKTLLGDSTKTPTSTLLAAVNADPSKGLAQVSAAYGMYYAYVTSQGGTVPNTPDAVLAGMNSDGFRDYVNNVDGKGQAEKDLAGYNGAMNMVNDSVTNKEQAEYVAMNGFGDAGLEALMKELLGGTTN